MQVGNNMPLSFQNLIEDVPKSKGLSFESLVEDVPKQASGKLKFVGTSEKGMYQDTGSGELVSPENTTFSQRLGAGMNLLTENFVDPAAKFAASAVRSPIDIARGVVGKTPLQDEITLPSGAKSQTIQSEFATETVPNVESGQTSPLAATADVVGQTVGGAADVLGASEAIKPISRVVGTTIEGSIDALAKARGIVSPLKKNSLQTIAETISPKLTAAERRLAMSQGRIIEGTESTLFKSGTPERVLTSDKVADAAFTIDKNIPNAAKLSEQELYTALEGRTTDMAKQIRPQMEATPISPNDITRLKTNWETLKNNQIAASDASEEVNVIKRQKQFEKRIDKITKGQGNHADLWDARIEYDNSVPDRVKKANALSDSRLLAQKEEWLQNRSILNDAITNSESNISGTIKDTFKEMSDMYNAKANLLAKAGVDSKIEPAKIIQWIKKNKWKSGLIAAGATSLVTGGLNVPKKVLDLATGLVL